MRLPRSVHLAAAVAMAKLLPAALAAGAASPTDANRAPPQGGVLEGANPSKYDPSNPIILFIIQVCLIVIVCHALHWPLAKIRQPRVIAEVVGGIILGPSVMGRIPGFRAAIFPKESLPNLGLVANLGLVLYLFLIGLETDVRFLARHWRVATSVAFAGLALPFGVGCALAWGVYHAFRDDGALQPIAFSVYMLFIGIALAITVCLLLLWTLTVGLGSLLTIFSRLSPSCAAFLPNSSCSTLLLASLRSRPVWPTTSSVSLSCASPPHVFCFPCAKADECDSRLGVARALRRPCQRWQWPHCPLDSALLSWLHVNACLCREARLDLAPPPHREHRK